MTSASFSSEELEKLVSDYRCECHLTGRKYPSGKEISFYPSCFGSNVVLQSTTLSRISGILLLGVFAVNIYLGLDDTNLRQLNPSHYDLNWLIAIVSLVAGLLLILRPKSRTWLTLGGIVWPVVYVLSLGVDVETKLCSGAPSSSCWPSHTAAFDYLILNYASIPNVPSYFGWKLAPVMPVAIILLAIVFILSLVSVNLMRRPVKPPVQPSGSGMPSGSDQPPSSPQK